MAGDHGGHAAPKAAAPSGGKGSGGSSGILSIGGYGEFGSGVLIIVGAITFIYVARLFMDYELAATIGKGIPLFLVTIAFPYFIFLRLRGPLNEKALLYPGRWLMLLGLALWCIWWPGQLATVFCASFWGGKMADYWEQCMGLSACIFLLTNLWYYRKGFWVTE